MNEYVLDAMAKAWAQERIAEAGLRRRARDARRGRRRARWGLAAWRTVVGGGGRTRRPVGGECRGVGDGTYARV